jgi:hypothetical protein
VDAQQLGHLVEHDDQPDAGLEAGEHRRGDEVGDEAQAQHRASISITPTSAASVAVAVTSLAGSPSGTTSPSCVPARMASVVVELTLSTRDEPSSA